MSYARSKAIAVFKNHHFWHDFSTLSHQIILMHMTFATGQHLSQKLHQLWKLWVYTRYGFRHKALKLAALSKLLQNRLETSCYGISAYYSKFTTGSFSFFSWIESWLNFSPIWYQDRPDKMTGSQIMIVWMYGRPDENERMVDNFRLRSIESATIAPIV